jgi:hypothetical protein
MSNIAAALRTAFGGKVNKAQMAAHVVSDQGEHGRMNGMHAHSHVHCDDKGNMYSHSHEHVHDDDGSHYHDYKPGHPDPEADANDGSGAATNDSKTSKAEEMTDQTKTPEQAANDHTHEEKAPAWLAAFSQALDVKLEEVKKAIPTEEALAKLVDDKIAAAVTPVVKAVEEGNLVSARTPKTPAPEGSIEPEAVRKAQSVSPAERKAAVKGMTLLDAIKYLNKNQ